MLTQKEYRPVELIAELIELEKYESHDGLRPTIIGEAAEHIEAMLQIIRKLDMANQVAERRIEKLTDV